VVITDGGSPLDAVVEGCTWCEVNQCDGTVGYGGSPDEIGETTLDAMIIDGETMNAGSVSDLRRVKGAIKVARAVMDYTKHTMLAGDSATDFAVEMGFVEESLTTPTSEQKHANWLANNCQPNYRTNVSPDPTKSCGPYTPTSNITSSHYQQPTSNRENHDTISMIVINSEGKIAAGTSTNGAGNKVPGRVGDGPIIGSGSYANDIGGCGATGDGDIMMRFLPCYQALENMRQGMTPTAACENVMRRIINYYPSFTGAVVAVDKISGEYGAAGYGWTFSYSVQTPKTNGVQVISVAPMKANLPPKITLGGDS